MKADKKLRKDFKEILENRIYWIDINGWKHNAGGIDESEIKVMVDKLLYRANEYLDRR